MTAAGQVPSPAQKACAVVAPSTQPAARQTTLDPAFAAHDARSVPSQLDTEHGLPGSLGHADRPGWGAPRTGLHVPALPATSHASQIPPHAELQQTLSAQNPVPHSAALAQGVPGSFVHAPSLPTTPHELPVGHDVVPQQTPSTQASGEAHGALSEQALPRPSCGTHVEDAVSQ